MNFLKCFSLLIITIGVAIGCTTIPTQEMSDARQAVQAARDAGAMVHAPDSFTHAEQRLAEAKQALDAGYYSEARRHAIAAKAEAIEAHTDTLNSSKVPLVNE